MAPGGTGIEKNKADDAKNISSLNEVKKTLHDFLSQKIDGQAAIDRDGIDYKKGDDGTYESVEEKAIEAALEKQSKIVDKIKFLEVFLDGLQGRVNSERKTKKTALKKTKNNIESNSSVEYMGQLFQAGTISSKTGKENTEMALTYGEIVRNIEGSSDKEILEGKKRLAKTLVESMNNNLENKGIPRSQKFTKLYNSLKTSPSWNENDTTRLSTIKELKTLYNESMKKQKDKNLYIGQSVGGTFKIDINRSMRLNDFQIEAYNKLKLLIEKHKDDKTFSVAQSIMASVVDKRINNDSDLENAINKIINSDSEIQTKAVGLHKSILQKHNSFKQSPNVRVLLDKHKHNYILLQTLDGCKSGYSFNKLLEFADSHKKFSHTAILSKVLEIKNITDDFDTRKSLTSKYGNKTSIENNNISVKNEKAILQLAFAQGIDSPNSQKTLTYYKNAKSAGYLGRENLVSFIISKSISGSQRSINKENRAQKSDILYEKAKKILGTNNDGSLNKSIRYNFKPYILAHEAGEHGEVQASAKELTSILGKNEWSNNTFSSILDYFKKYKSFDLSKPLSESDLKIYGTLEKVIVSILPEGSPKGSAQNIIKHLKKITTKSTAEKLLESQNKEEIDLHADILNALNNNITKGNIEGISKYLGKDNEKIEGAKDILAENKALKDKLISLVKSNDSPEAQKLIDLLDLGGDLNPTELKVANNAVDSSESVDQKVSTDVTAFLESVTHPDKISVEKNMLLNAINSTVKNVNPDDPLHEVTNYITDLEERLGVDVKGELYNTLIDSINVKLSSNEALAAIRQKAAARKEKENRESIANPNLNPAEAASLEQENKTLQDHQEDAQKSSNRLSNALTMTDATWQTYSDAHEKGEKVDPELIKKIQQSEPVKKKLAQRQRFSERNIALIRQGKGVQAASDNFALAATKHSKMLQEVSKRNPGLIPPDSEVLKNSVKIVKSLLPELAQSSHPKSEILREALKEYTDVINSKPENKKTADEKEISKALNKYDFNKVDLGVSYSLPKNGQEIILDGKKVTFYGEAEGVRSYVSKEKNENGTFTTKLISPNGKSLTVNLPANEKDALVNMEGAPENLYNFYNFFQNEVGFQDISSYSTELFQSMQKKDIQSGNIGSDDLIKVQQHIIALFHGEKDARAKSTNMSDIIKTMKDISGVTLNNKNPKHGSEGNDILLYVLRQHKIVGTTDGFKLKTLQKIKKNGGLFSIEQNTINQQEITWIKNLIKTPKKQSLSAKKREKIQSIVKQYKDQFTPNELEAVKSLIKK